MSSHEKNEEIMEEATKTKPSLTLKLFVIGFLCLLFMIPSLMVTELVRERSDRKDDAVSEVSQKWGGAQTALGPILVIPYNKYDTQSRTTERKYAYFLPKTLDVQSAIESEVRSRGIYDVPLYQGNIAATGVFSAPDPNKLSLRPSDMLWDQAFVSLGIPDLKGVTDQITLDWAGNAKTFEPGVERTRFLSSGVSVPVELATPNEEGVISQKTYSFNINLNIRGSQDLYFFPLGEQTNVAISSDWPSPSFDGAFLPDERTVTDTGFTARWKVLNLNRTFPQQWTSDDSVSFKYNATNFDRSPYEDYYDDGKGGSSIQTDSGFGVRLFMPVDVYQKTERSSKYAFAVVALLFVTIFFIEMIVKKMVHPLQYILIGLALIIFYTLLLSLSEYIPFGWAYLVAGLAIVGMIGLFMRSVVKSNRLGFISAGVIAILYGFIYVLIQSQDYTLLIGSIGLFIILAILMYVSRYVNWYGNNGGQMVK